LEEATRVAQKYVIVQEDLQGQSKLEADQEYLHEWSGNFRSDEEWQHIFSLLGMTLEHQAAPPSSCAGGYEVKRQLYVLKASTAPSKKPGLSPLAEESILTLGPETIQPRVGRIALAWTATLEACEAFQNSFRSAAAQLALDNAHGSTNLVYNAYLFADNECRSFLENDKTFLQGTSQLLKLNVLDLKEIAELPGADINMFRKGASARLYLPEALPVDGFLYMDSDAIATGSFAPIVATMEKEKNAVLFMSEEVDSSVCTDCGGYSHEDLKEFRWGPNGLNSGILGVNINSWRSRAMSSRVSDIINKFEGRLKLGDQDIFNILSKDDSALLHVLPCESNWRCDSQCSSAPIFLHGNHQTFKYEWKNLFNKLLEAADRVLISSTSLLQTNLPTSLWEMTFPGKHSVDIIPTKLF
jgi:hypothetical protein